MKELCMNQFDPNGAAEFDGIFGLPYEFENSELVIIPVPWEATTSYGGGTSKGPEAILEASYQVDLFDLEVVNPYSAGIFLANENRNIKKWNQIAKREAQKIIKVGGQIGKNKALAKSLATVNKLGLALNEEVLKESRKVLAARKILGLVGGDHSTPFGAIQAVAEKEKDFGILHFDAHSDTRVAYEGFQWSHASIMYNVMENIPVKKLVQVGIRDFCEAEWNYIHAKNSRIKTFFDLDTAKRKQNGENWNSISEEIIQHLPEKVWVSFDIDGLDPRFCPHTGTPVPGGLDYGEALTLLHKLAQKRKIIGFDLNEVSPGKHSDWDANVGARLLYKLSAYTLASQGKVKFLPR